MRLIDAELIEKDEGWLDGTCLVIPKQIIYDAPTIDAEPVRHGHWIGPTMACNGDYFVKCSLCRRTFAEGKQIGMLRKYCPWCGGKMDG